jgi:hypothetical protein
MKPNTDKEPKIIAAAIRQKGVTFTGVRHGEIIGQMVRLGVLKEVDGVKEKVSYEAQGFITSTNKFVSREVANDIAFRAGQLVDKPITLYSEDLW